MRCRLRSLLTLALGISLCACGAATPAVESSEQEVHARPSEAERPPPTPSLAEGVVQVEAGCVEGRAESCNALDDDCDGALDEGCEGRQPSDGGMEIALTWNSGADLDLYVTDPTGFTLSFQEREGGAGGHLDRDARGDCAEREPRLRTESARYGSELPSGRYEIEVRHFSTCGAEGETTATLSVSVRGQLLGSYNFHIEPEQRVPVLRVEL